MGPKRREGDLQVPEGFYRLPELNPRSSYHLSIRVDYPNGDDIAHAAVARGDMGGDIYIHGSDVSIGCMALGDRAIEELFLMAAMVPEPSRRIIISPYDFRRSPRAPLPRSEGWVTELYRRIIAELRAFPRSGA
jgi:murein L,D-transpeptidase YafK